MINNYLKLKMRTSIIILVIAIVLAGIIGFIIGKNSTGNALANNSETSTFYATIIAVSDETFHVKGLEVNDVNYRSEFTFVVDDKVKLEWRHEPMTVAEFREGQNISITFSGPIMESFPAQISEIIKIQLLEDEK